MPPPSLQTVLRKDDQIPDAIHPLLHKKFVFTGYHTLTLCKVAVIGTLRKITGSGSPRGAERNSRVTNRKNLAYFDRMSGELIGAFPSAVKVGDVHPNSM